MVRSGEKPTKLKAFGYGSICAGLIALVSSYSTAKGATNLGGVASLVVASAMWAVYTLRFRRSGHPAIASCCPNLFLVGSYVSALLLCAWALALSASIRPRVSNSIPVPRIANECRRHLIIQSSCQLTRPECCGRNHGSGTRCGVYPCYSDPQ